MIKAILRKKDGTGQRSWLRSAVKSVQQGLANAGYVVGVDGLFGSGTRSAGIEFQQDQNLDPTGIFDKATWTSLTEFLPQPSAEFKTLLTDFNGDIDWVHQQEGHRGRPYWPGGVSGITLDPGVDLGHASTKLVEELYHPFLTNKQIAALEAVQGFKGQDARDALRRSPIIQGIRISDEQGIALMPHTAKPYWTGITRRFPALKRKDTPASVQTVLLSLAYNRGILNRHLDTLGDPLKSRKWNEVAEIVGDMQQSHKLKGIRIRRRQESWVIKAELDFLAS